MTFENLLIRLRGAFGKSRDQLDDSEELDRLTPGGGRDSLMTLTGSKW